MTDLSSCNIVNGRYRYMEDLLALEATATGRGPAPFVPATPLKPAAWHNYLVRHPDQGFAQYILTGFQQGFHIGVDRAHLQFQRATRNLRSVVQNHQIVEQHIREETEAGRLLGPLPPQLAALCHISPIGLIPKTNQPGKWRLIVDLSTPQGASINDAIDSSHCSLHYASMEDAVQVVRHLGPGTLLAKLDLRKAYRVIPVHPDDHALLGIKWESQVYIDTALPFGLCSAPKIFSAVADALAWAFHCRGICWQLHYLDDFLFFGPPGQGSCTQALRTALDTCQELGMPVAMDKVEGPASKLTFLGIQVDTRVGELSLPPVKLTRTLQLVQSWLGRRAATKRQLQSLIGSLSHAATVVSPGRTFLRRLIDLAKSVHKPHHFVRLNEVVRSDLHWWSCFLVRWNGRSLILPEEPSTTIYTDASGSWGCGALLSNGQWFQLQWPTSWEAVHIAAKEMVPIAVAVAVWGRQLSGQSLLVKSDNMAVVAALRSGSCKDQLLMHLLRCLHFFSAHFQLRVQASHIPGSCNDAADALSRNSLGYFRSIVPQAPLCPTGIPPALVDMLLLNRPDWTSSNWRRMFMNTLSGD